MGNTNPWKTQQSHNQSFTRKFLPYVLYAILPLVLIHFYLYPSPPLLQSPTKDHFSYTPISTTIVPSTSSAEQKSENGVLDSVSVSLKEKETGNEALQQETKENENENFLQGSQENGNGNEKLYEESKENGNGNENFNQESKENVNENFNQESKENVNENVHQETILPPEEKEIVNEIMNSSSLTLKEEESKIENLPEEKGNNEISSTSCDYTNGEWVQDSQGPLYNGSSCGTIKDGQNCMRHGRPDTDYLYWKWKPRQCDLPRFDPRLLLQFLEGKHLAFVGDSMARNQLESLLCMLSSVSPPNLIYTSGDDNKFRRWHFPSHNVKLSVYWSPFLVKGIEKSSEQDYNRLFFESIDERWGSDLDSIDMVVLSVGHWYLHPAIYRDGDVELGCHAVNSVNCTETEFYGVYGKAFNTSLKAIVDRKLGKEGNGIDVIVTTFSPHHFEGEWDKFGACPKTKPYLEAEKSLEGMDGQMRDRQVDEVEKAKMLINAANNASPKVRVAALDITKLALLRPDGHPGPYMYANPFAEGIKERVHNDCVHWCLPGPIDTWNEIMLDVVKQWYRPSMK